jgi:hypothetical protein
VQVAVGVDLPTVADAASAEASPNIWTNPFSAGALVLGLAIVVGVLVKEATDAELVSTTFQN